MVQPGGHYLTFIPGSLSASSSWLTLCFFFLSLFMAPQDLFISFDPRRRILITTTFLFFLFFVQQPPPKKKGDISLSFFFLFFFTHSLTDWENAATFTATQAEQQSLWWERGANRLYAHFAYLYLISVVLDDTRICRFSIGLFKKNVRTEKPVFSLFSCWAFNSPTREEDKKGGRDPICTSLFQ